MQQAIPAGVVRRAIRQREFDAAEGRSENEGRVPGDADGMPEERKGNGQGAILKIGACCHCDTDQPRLAVRRGLLDLSLILQPAQGFR